MARLSLWVAALLALMGSAASSQFIVRNPAAASANPIDAARLPAGSAALPEPAWALAGVTGGIPTTRTRCTTGTGTSVIAAYTGTAATINTAISGCDPNHFVELGAGNFPLSTAIAFSAKSSITLKGQGANSTFIVMAAASSSGCHGFSASICVDSTDTNWPGGPSNTANWTAGYTKGTTTITLSAVTNLKVGNYLMLDQSDDTVDDGTLYVCERGTASSATTCSDDGATGGPSGAQRNTDNGGSATDRGQTQLVKVASCDGNSTVGHVCVSGTNLTITPGLYMPNWASGKSPGAWWATTPISGVGLEDFSIDATTPAPYATMELFNCADCWVKGIRSNRDGIGERAHVDLSNSPRATIRDNYFFGGGSLSRSYGVQVYPSSDSLIENNIWQKTTAPVMLNGDCQGCVVGYNYSLNNWNTLDVDASCAAAPDGSCFVMHLVHFHSVISMVLVEGNEGVGLYGDIFHGSHAFNTAFRNYFHGIEVGKTGSRSDNNPFRAMPKTGYYNFVGNVLGSATQTTYDKYPASGGTISKAIYTFGVGSGGTPQVADDTRTRLTSMRWGNYDSVSAATKFDSSEVPSGLATYANPVPATQTLPSSLYLSVKPSFFGSIPWPPHGPDVTGGNVSGLGGHANHIPAYVCYTTTMSGPADGSGSILTFNRTSCY